MEGTPTSYIRKWLFEHKNGLIWPNKSKNTPKISRSALAGDLTGVALATNHSVFNK